MAGLFSNLFNKSPQIQISDKVWMSETEKLKALGSDVRQFLKDGKSVFVICFFEETKFKLEEIFHDLLHRADLKIIYTKHNDFLNTGYSENVVFIGAEHFPLIEREQSILSQIQEQFPNSKITFYISLEDPLLKLFGGENILRLMKSIGMKEDEFIEHSMISSSIQNAKKRILEKVQIEQSAKSATEWFKKNMNQDFF